MARTDESRATALGVFLHSLCEHVLDATECVEAGDAPDGPDEFIAVPRSVLEDLRAYALFFQAQGDGLT